MLTTQTWVLQVCLKDGERWDQAFMNGLCSSWVVVMLVSNGCLEPMTKLVSNESQNEACDNVLLVSKIRGVFVAALINQQ